MRTLSQSSEEPGVWAFHHHQTGMRCPPPDLLSSQFMAFGKPLCSITHAQSQSLAGLPFSDSNHRPLMSDEIISLLDLPREAHLGDVGAGSRIYSLGAGQSPGSL